LYLHGPNHTPRFNALPESQLIDMTRPVGCVKSITNTEFHKDPPEFSPQSPRTCSPTSLASLDPPPRDPMNAPMFGACDKGREGIVHCQNGVGSLRGPRAPKHSSTPSASFPNSDKLPAGNFIESMTRVAVREPSQVDRTLHDRFGRR